MNFSPNAVLAKLSNWAIFTLAGIDPAAVDIEQQKKKKQKDFLEHDSN